MIILNLILTLSYSTGMYAGNEKIGYSNIDVEPEGDGYRIEEKVSMRVEMIGQQRTMEVFSIFELDGEYRLIKYDFKLDTYSQSISSNGMVTNGSLNYSVKTGGKRTSATINFDGDLYVPQSIPLLVSSKRSDLYISVFDPTLMAVNKARVSILEDMGDSIKYRTEILGATSITWAERDGAIIRSEEPLGVLVVREEEERAQEFGKKSPEILSMFAIPAGMQISNPRETTYLKAIVKGKFKTTDRQQLIGDTLFVQAFAPESLLKREPSSLFGCSCKRQRKVLDELQVYLQATPLIQADDEEIRKTASRIVRWSRDDWEEVLKITSWVSNSVEDFPSATIPSALDVLETLKGDCNEHATLFCALSRAAGIPTDIVVGLVYMNGYFYYHAWNKVWIGSGKKDDVGMWFEVDPTFNQTIADATHITLEEGGLQDWAKILALVGNIDIKVLEYR